MQIKLAKKYGFCFGVKRAIQIAEKTKNSITLGPLIHNPKEISRLEVKFGVRVEEDTQMIKNGEHVIIRTHGIPKGDLEYLKTKDVQITDATCPYVTKPQEIVEFMSKEGYQIIIFGDKTHPEVKGVMSYSTTQPIVVSSLEELKEAKIGKKIALVSQTTKQANNLLQIASYLITHCYEARIFNTICNATLDNQESARELSKEVDVMIVVGGKTSSNTKQLLNIALQNCTDSYLVEDENDLDMRWFEGKNICGITAGASTPDWIIDKVKEKIQSL
ncbi:4-hydroxy-3-methylbut-2-enyl diphosphate reductase [Helicobacter cappadocius]|uniref:4-hydroxy-3-methylbut-2-enyl diphosphate reductase n=1 Tax=Helicobacter cappadocius TaxID=3063998 RepID=A0AA90PHU0_9HELI|nr:MULTISPECIES: 4-hydroxy-3-methylbut-2-enyl diphosphate reductase [unclassified Helicobacter]MDO7252680.1 4-hydroxy-3-methylbut-2-enyl diphosphate reductase [Helicobacter sp. faydin-H75]MDP2538547.1 4-hydroxy-3-methylbut-2-enyl diphosphate reductase [Helicobacter sp. faydin-H76]